MFDKVTKRLYLKLELTFVDEVRSNFVTALVDTGADVNLINVNFLKRLFPNVDIDAKMEETSLKVQGFTGGDISLVGSIKICTRGHERLSYRELDFLVYDLDNGFPIILGLKVLEHLSLNLIYKEHNKVKRPYLIHENPEFGGLITSYHLSDFDCATCKLTFELPPESSDVFTVSLPDYINLIQGDMILISDDFVGSEEDSRFEVFETTSELQQNYYTGTLEAAVQICNYTKKSLIKSIHLSFEVVNNCDAKEIDRFNVKNLKFSSLIVPLSRDKIKFDNIADSESTDSDFQSAEVLPFPHLFDVTLNNLLYLPNFPQNSFLLDTLFPQHNEFQYGDPLCVNNNAPNPDISLTDSRSSVPAFDECTPELEAKFNDPKCTIQLGIQNFSDDAIEEQMRREGGYTVPNNLHLPPEHFVNLEEYEVEQRPFIKKLFIEKYPGLVSRHSLDLGNLSKTLGYYRLKLKKFAKLPRFRKIYYLNASELQQLQVILQFLLKYDAISKVDVGGNHKDLHMDEFASPSYLIPRSNPSSSARLIVNYRHLNQLIETEACHIDTAQSVINGFRESYLFTNLDLSCAFQSIRLTEDSRDLTLFSTPLGTYRSHILPTGVKSSPNTLSSIMFKAIHYEVCRDPKGEIIYEEGLPKMEFSPLPNVKNIYDDLILGTPLCNSYIETLTHHFELLDKVLGRLHFHNGKLSFPKCHFARTCIAFFGVFLAHKFVCVDPARIRKILERPFPENLKGMRSVLGLIGSIREKLGMIVNLDLQWLYDLTKTKLKDFKPTTEHFEAFARIKKFLTHSSLFSNIIDPSADKVLFTDSAVGLKSCFSAVLGQIVKPNNVDGKVHIPDGLNLADRNHRFVFDNRKAYQPLPLIAKGQTISDYRIMVKEYRPPAHDYLSMPFYGWEESDAELSLPLCLKHLYHFWNKDLDYKGVCAKMISNIRGNVYGAQFRTYFNNDENKYKLFLKNLQNGKFPIDKDFIIFDVLSEALLRPVHVISTYYVLQEELRVFGTNYTTPPLCLFIYKCATKQGQSEASVKDVKLARKSFNIKRTLSLATKSNDDFFLVALPAHVPNVDSFRYDRFRGGFEIVSYLSKALPSKSLDSHIYENELNGILVALLQYRKLIGDANLLLLTDNKCLFYLFSESMLESSVKLSRWKKKLILDYRNLEFGFVKSEDNLADFLSRRYEIERPILRRLQLPRFVKPGLEHIMDKEVYTVDEWSTFVNNNQDFLGEIQPTEDAVETHYKVNILTRAQLAKRRSKFVHTLGGRMGRTQKALLSPIEHLRNLLCNENLVAQQKVEFKDLYTKCLTRDEEVKGYTYFLQDNLLFYEKGAETKIMLPTKYLNPLVALGHLLCNHHGYEKVNRNLANFYHESLCKRIMELCSVCFACQLSNWPNRNQKLGYYNTSDSVMETMCMDLAENLPANNGYKHILIMVDPISDVTLAYPMKTKSSNEFIMIVLFQLYQILPNLKQILCDNAAHFVSHKTLQLLTAYGIHVIYSAAFHSYGHGLAESHVRLIKSALIKTVTNEKCYNWLYALPKIIANHNQSVNVKTKYAPLELLYGKSTNLSSSPFTDIANLSSIKVHPRLRDKHDQIELITDELSTIVAEGKKNIDEERTKRIEERNKTRVNMHFEKDDIVLVKSHSKTLGKPAALQPYYQLSPYRVQHVHETTCTVIRLTNDMWYPENIENIVALPREFRYPKGHLKKYKELPDKFKDLPPQVLSILSKKFTDLTSDDIKFLVSKDDFDIPPPYSVAELIEREEKSIQQARDTPSDSSRLSEVPGNQETGSAGDKPEAVGAPDGTQDVALNTEEVVKPQPFPQDEEDVFSSDEDLDPNQDKSTSNEKNKSSTHSHRLRRNPKKVTFHDFVT